MTVPDYHDIVQAVVHNVEHDASPLLDRVRLRVATLVDHQRFEDAALVRDRWLALRTSIISQRRRTALQQAGRIQATGADGVAAVIDRGRLTSIWRAARDAPLVAIEITDATSSAETMVDGEEAELIWAWLSAPGVTIESVTGTLAYPSIEVPALDAIV